MSIPLNRREFLQSLIALGASFSVPVNATPEQIEAVWEKAQSDPWYFDVNNSNTISVSGYQQDETWGDVFCVSTRSLKTPDDVISEIHSCQPLISHFQHLAELELDDLIQELENDPPPSPQRRRKLQKALKSMESDPDYGWEDWIKLEGHAGVPRFRDEIEEWLAEPADYLQFEWFPMSYGGQGQAKVFFEDLDPNTLDALGVVIIEGEHPGSTYYAAELRQDIDDANTVAEELGLPFRFRPE